MRLPPRRLAVGVLHVIAGDAATLLRTYRGTLCPGSVLVLSHTSDDHDDPEVAARMRAACEAYRGSATEPTIRDRRRIRALLGDLEPVPPGLVDITDWPDPQPGEPIGIDSAVARIAALDAT